MSKSFGYIQHAMICRREFRCQPLGKSRRIGSEVDNDVVNGSPRAANQFSFFVGSDLVVHAPQRSFLPVEGHAALGQPWIKAIFHKLPLAPGAGEKSPLIFVPLGLDDERPF